MRVDWFGQSAFALSTLEAKVFIDPFGDMSALAGRGMQFEYPAIDVDEVDLLLVTHEHHDHNPVEVIAGDPQLCVSPLADSNPRSVRCSRSLQSTTRRPAPSAGQT
jgi:L-ascorbate metabolism protein UlaG (beta-lactamase superfamily)